jgi:hypothetical protein
VPALRCCDALAELQVSYRLCAGLVQACRLVCTRILSEGCPACSWCTSCNSKEHAESTAEAAQLAAALFVRVYRSMPRTLADAAAKGWAVVGAAAESGSVPVSQFKVDRPTVLVMGELPGRCCVSLLVLRVEQQQATTRTGKLIGTSSAIVAAESGLVLLVQLKRPQQHCWTGAVLSSQAKLCCPALLRVFQHQDIFYVLLRDLYLWLALVCT